SRHWAKSKNPQHPAVKREAEEDWGRERWRWRRRRKRRGRILPFASTHGPLMAKASWSTLPGVEDYQVALATFRAACERWPNTPITLRQGARASSRTAAHAPGVS